MLHHDVAGWRIRLFNRDDARACQQVFNACVNEFSWLKEDQAPPPNYAMPNDELVTWVADAGRAGVVGFLTLRPRKAYVSYLLVERDWRLCGIGSGLIEAAHTHVAGPMSLHVDADNSRARNAYRALGWYEIGPETFAGRAQIRMVSTGGHTA